MMLLGKKIGMTQVYDDQGKVLPVTVIQAGPCSVTQIKTEETDGYNSIQLGFDDIKKSRQKAPAVGHFKKANVEPKRFIKEMRLGSNQCEYNLGDEVTVAAFADVKAVDITGVSKGKGFAGVMKRHDFGGFPGSHGTKRKHRHPGSIASFASDAGMSGKIKKGKKMPGHMGNVTVTTKNHSLVSIDEERNLLVVKGAVAGAADGYLVIKVAKSG